MPQDHSVVSIVIDIAKCVAEPIGHELAYIIFYHNNVARLETEIKDLEAVKSDLENSVAAADRNGEKIFQSVSNWLEKADGILAKAKEFSTTNSAVRCLSGSFPSPCSRHQLSKKAKDMADEISQVMEKGKFPQISFVPRVRVAASPLDRGYEALNSRTSKLNEVMEALKHPNISRVGVCGMGGVGKSMLIKEVAWQAEKDGSLGAVIMAEVKQSPDVRNIQLELASGLGLIFKEEDQKGRAQRLRQRIEREDNILVILDDIWKTLDLTNIGVPIDHRGCKLLLTGRDLQVLHYMDTQKKFRLEALLPDESWELFKKTAGEVVQDIELESTAIEVAKSCKGSPLLIVTVAKALRTKAPHAWKNALQQLTKHEGGEFVSLANEAIELSYHCLTSDDHRSLFLLIFSDGKKSVYIEDLLIVGWGLGRYKNFETLAEARNNLYTLIDELKASSLLLEGEKEWVSMHDLVCKGAAKIASKKDYPVFCVPSYTEFKAWAKMDQCKNYKAISLPWCYMDQLPECLKCPELEVLQICSEGKFLEVPNQFFSEMSDLKVLYLGEMICTPSLPESLDLLKSLRALYLCRCILDDISIVSELTDLEILSLENSQIQELPQKLEQLIHLRMLNLGGCSRLRQIPAKLLSSLTRLEELYMGNCYIQWEVEGSNQSNRASLGELRDLQHLQSLELQIQDVSIMPWDFLIFGNLERYKILIGDGWKWSWNYSGFFETSKILKLNLSSTTVNHSDGGVKILLDKVEDLHLAEIKEVPNVLPELNGGGFRSLKHLHIQNCSEMVSIIGEGECSHLDQAFPSLQSLIICNLINLEKICPDPLSIDIFKKLQVIKVKGCDSLQNLFSFSMVRNLQQLLEIEISDCKSMTNIIVGQGKEDCKDNGWINFPIVQSIKLENLPLLISFCSEQCSIHMSSISRAATVLYDKVAMPNLETIKLSSINMVKIWDDISASTCIQNLTNLTIDNCCSLKYLFSPEVSRALEKLHYLEVTNCHTVEEIFELEGKKGNISSAKRPLSHEKVKFPNLEALVISHMDILKSIGNNELAPNPFPKMTKMEVSFCPKLLNVIPSYLLEKLQSLETLHVADCGALEFVFETQGLDKKATNEGMLATQLRTLTFERLPKLQRIWSEDPCGRIQFQNLYTMKVTDCEILTYVFPLSVVKELKQLQVLDIRNCGVVNIVAKDERLKEVPRLLFRQLTSMTLWNLAKLERFYPEIHTLDCPLISKLDVYHCSRMQVSEFDPHQSSNVTPIYGELLFSSLKVVRRIEQLSLSSDNVRKILNDCGFDIYTVKALSLGCFHDASDKFPVDFLRKFTRLEVLKVRCSSFIEIFSSENVGRIMKLKTLQLDELKNLQYLCKEKSEIQQILQHLETLEVFRCSRLKNIASTISFSIFENLVKLWVDNCSGLVNIATSSLAKSLLKLRNLLICNCEMIEEIVASEDESNIDEITFMKLEHLELKNLPRLTSFCKGKYGFKFPLLKTLYLIECPEMETFSHGNLSTPNLRKVLVTPTANGEWHWEGELNTTIMKIFSEKHTSMFEA